MSRYPDRVLTIRYQDFLTNQEQVLRKVGDLFGADYLARVTERICR